MDDHTYNDSAAYHADVDCNPPLDELAEWAYRYVLFLAQHYRVALDRRRLKRELQKLLHDVEIPLDKPRR